MNEKGRTRIEADVTIKTCFKAHLEAFNIVLKLPVPKWTASAVVKVPVGRAKYNAEKKGVIWKIRSINGQQEITMTCTIDLISATMHDKLNWSRPPISMDFQVPWYRCAGAVPPGSRRARALPARMYASTITRRGRLTAVPG